jgi:hypothetical protein
MDAQGQAKRAYTYQGTVQVGKFSVVFADSSVTNDGFRLGTTVDLMGAGGANGGAGNAALGIIEEGIVPPGIGASDYVAGSYENVSQQPWPTNISPTTPQGKFRRSVVWLGPIRGRNGLAGGWSRGDRLFAYDNLGHLASVVTAGLPAGTQFFCVGYADEPTANVGDVSQVIVEPHWDRV